jgi:SAM-dependent methyltransferase
MFDRIGGGYDARPDYPVEVFDTLVARCGLGPGAQVLEIGAGTGKATLPMLALGAHVTAVEPGPALVDVLTTHAAGQPLDVVPTRFEDAALPACAFDLVASATAYHWVDPHLGVEAVAAALRPGGHVALWWTLWHDPDRPDPFRDALATVLEAEAPHLLEDQASHAAYARDVDARAALFDESPRFGPVDLTVMRWAGTHDPLALRRLYATFASWVALPDMLRAELLDEVERIARDEFDGVVRSPYQTRLYLAERVATAP